MTNTAKDTTTEPQLKWTSTKEWGSVGNTHRAEADGWKYVVDQPRKGEWVVRGWNEDAAFKLYVPDLKTMKAAKVYAEENAASVRRDVAEAQISTCDECQRIASHKLDCSEGRRVAVAKDQARGTKLADADLKIIPAAAASAAAGLQVMADIVRGLDFQGRARNLVLSHQACTCPSPTHRMNCGEGGRVKVVQRPQQASGRWSVTQPELTVFPARKGGAA